VKEWHRELANLHVYSQGMTNVEIAQKLGKARNSVQHALKRDDVQELIDQLRAEKEQFIAQSGTELVTEMVSLSWQTLREVMNNPDASDGARVSAATAILKGTGQLVEKQQMEHKGVFGVIVVDD